MEEVSRRSFIKGAGTAVLAAGAATAAGSVLTALEAGPAGATTTWGNIEGDIFDEGGQVFNIKNPAWNGTGAYGDTVILTAGSITSGTAAFTAPSGTFVSGDAGKVITVQGAGASGAVLSTTISTYNSSSSVTLATNASTTANGTPFAYGHDDTAVIVAAVNSAQATSANGGRLFVPAGIYMILGASNGGNPIDLTSTGGLLGVGGTSVAGVSTANSLFLCGDANAGILANGSATYQGFAVDGNNIATEPLATTAASNLMFFDVYAKGSAGNGWTVLGAANSHFYSCGSTANAQDGIYIDQGASNLSFWHFEEFNNKRYGIHGDTAHGGTTSGIHFYDGICDTPSSGAVQGTSKIYVRSGTDWKFHGMKIVGTDLTGPTVDLDHSSGYNIDFHDCTISGTPLGSSPGNACIQVSNTCGTALSSPIGTGPYNFLASEGATFLGADTSIYVASTGSYTYSACQWVYDGTTYGPVAGSGGSGKSIETVLAKHTSAWRSVSSYGTGWTGTVKCRMNSNGLAQLQGPASGGTSGTTAFTLPTGYAPARAIVVPAAMGSGLAYVSIDTSGNVKPTTASGSGSVYFDHVSYPLS